MRSWQDYLLGPMLTAAAVAAGWMCGGAGLAGCWGEQGKAAQHSSGKSAGERTSFIRDCSDPNRPTCSHNWQTKADDKRRLLLLPLAG